MLVDRGNGNVDVAWGALAQNNTTAPGRGRSEPPLSAGTAARSRDLSPGRPVAGGRGAIAGRRLGALEGCWLRVPVLRE